MNEHLLTDSDTLAKWQESSEHRNLKERLALALKAMKGRKHEICTLLLQGKSQDEIAIVLGISRSSVDTYYRRAVKELRALLHE